MKYSKSKVLPALCQDKLLSAQNAKIVFLDSIQTLLIGHTVRIYAQFDAEVSSKSWLCPKTRYFVGHDPGSTNFKANWDPNFEKCCHIWNFPTITVFHMAKMHKHDSNQKLDSSLQNVFKHFNCALANITSGKCTLWKPFASWQLRFLLPQGNFSIFDVKSQMYFFTEIFHSCPEATKFS